MINLSQEQRAILELAPPPIQKKRATSLPAILYPSSKIPPDTLSSSPSIRRNITQSDDDTLISSSSTSHTYQQQPGTLVRINAAAGTGKTTTLIELARKCVALGHKRITYVTFSKSAANDAKFRTQRALVESARNKCDGEAEEAIVEAFTLHSCAMRLLRVDDDDDDDDHDNHRFLDDDDMRAYVAKTCHKEISKFLAVAYDSCESECPIKGDKRAGAIKAMQRRSHDQVVTFICKTFEMFCRSRYTLKEFGDGRFKWRHYYPAKLFHQTGGKGGTSYHFPQHVYGNLYSFYADQAYNLWTTIVDGERKLKSYNIEMKRAQLANLEIPASVLLVDESQDMDQCQVDWVSKQISFGTHVFFVGDAAQSIYSFRGAKPQNIMNLKQQQQTIVIDRRLTTSWRFGPEIATMANIVLYAKEKSPQTTCLPKKWDPYRVVGGGEGGVVTQQALNWRDGPVTILASTNAALLTRAVELIGWKSSRGGDYGDGSVELLSGVEEIPSADIRRDDDGAEVAEEMMIIPKIHINGQGESSGLNKWKSVVKQIGYMYDLYLSEEEQKLPEKMFKEWQGTKVTWKTFVDDVESRELTKYASGIMVVDKFKMDTMTAIEIFQEEVMKKNYAASEADVILSTCHAAKGMEWDRVEVVNDFVNIGFKTFDNGPQVEIAPADDENNSDTTAAGSQRCSSQDNNSSSNEELSSPYSQSQQVPKKRKRTRPVWQFNFKSYGDDVNIIYVACTRAKKVLSIPPSLLLLLNKLDTIHDFKLVFDNKKINNNIKKETTTDENSHREQRQQLLNNDDDDDDSNNIVVQFGDKQKLCVNDVKCIHADLCMPLRKELGISDDKSLVDELVPSLSMVAKSETSHVVSSLSNGGLSSSDGMTA